MATTQLKLLPDDSMSSTTDFCTRRKSASATMSFEQNLIYGSEKSCRHRKISLCNTPGTTSQSNHGKNNKVRITEPHSSSSCSSSVTSESGRSTPQDQFSTNHKKSCKAATESSTMKSGSHKKRRGFSSLVFLLNLNNWIIWCPVWLPMIFVITPPLSEFCNLRTGLFILLLAFLHWNSYYWRQWRHLLINATWSAYLYALLVPRLWPTRIERHCEKCEAVLQKQVNPDQTVGWKLRCWRRFPLRILSRNWGKLAYIQMRPHFLNTLLIYIYAKGFGCDIEEAAVSDLSQYACLGDFFTRKLKPEVRPLERTSGLVSPVDGTVTHVGPFQGGFLEQVKGVHYSLSYFLGLPGSKSDNHHHEVVHGAVGVDGQDLLRHKDGSTMLHQAVIYLSPGDYHRFHSPPVDFKVHLRRHFPGELLSVKPSVVAGCPGLFHLNERVSWIGEHQHGFFSLTAVGATNVGSVHMDDESKFDPDLKTNKSTWKRRHCDVAHPCSNRKFVYSEKSFHPEDPHGQPRFRQGDPFGYFTFGSTIVLIFEAPKNNFRFTKQAGDRVRVGQALFSNY